MTPSKAFTLQAHGLDGIPNIVLQRCADILISRLTTIYRAIFNLNAYYDPWKEFTTVVSAKKARQTKL